MKKLYIGLMILFLFGFTFAQQITGQTTMDVKVDANVFAQMGEKIQKVDLDFCGKYGIKSIQYPYRFGSDIDLCFNIFNGSDHDVTVNIGFVDGMFTNDERKNRACGQADDVDMFGSYVTGYTANLVLKQGESKTEYATIHYPKDSLITGSTIQGCLVYSLVSNDTGANPSVGFGVLVRKAKFIDLNIKKAPLFDIRYLSVILIVGVLALVLYRKKLFFSKGK